MNQSTNPQQTKLEAVVAVFDDPEQAQRAARQLHHENIEFKRLSGSKSASESLDDLVYEEIDTVDTDSVSKGIGVGGGIGAGAGLVLMAIPGLGFAAPIAGFLGGALIGGMAGIDESVRAIELPGPIDYRSMVAEGKSLLAIAGSEEERLEYAKKLEELGATTINQHPPTNESIR